MAFQRSAMQPFCRLLVDLERTSPAAAAGGPAASFLIEERLTEPREDRYWDFLEAPGSEEGWLEGHRCYLSRCIHRWEGAAETFGQSNRANWLPELEPPQMLARMERVSDLAKLANSPDREPQSLSALLESFLAQPEAQPARGAVAKLLRDYNSCRDRRPAFAGFWGEVEDLFDNPADSHSWANRLRDRFGLGHLDPLGGEPIPVVLFRYRVREVMAGRRSQDGFAAVPTVLDCALTPFFFPSPRQSAQGASSSGGHCLNLEAGSAEDYRFSSEILHQPLRYRPRHLFRTGWITASPGKSCQQARSIHLQQTGHRFGTLPGRADS